MRWNARLSCLFGLVLTMRAVAFVQTSANDMGQMGVDSRLQPYVEKISELSSRARANVYYSNPQSIFNGVQVGFVNVGTGNITFIRRDLVASGRVPIVLARIYDSANQGSSDFGPGWLLSAAETLSLENGKARLLGENGSIIDFTQTADGRSFRLEREYPSDYLTLAYTGSDTVTATLRTGLVKEFRRTSAPFFD